MTDSERHGVKPGGVAIAFLVLVGACQRTPAPSPGSEAGHPRVGDQAPAFTLPSAGGAKVSLEDFAHRQPVLLYFSMGPG